MSTPQYHEQVTSIDDIIIKYVNHLLHQHAQHQSMLMDRQGDAHWIKCIDEVRAKNTELEQKVQDLRRVNHDLAAALDAEMFGKPAPPNPMGVYKMRPSEDQLAREKRTTRMPHSQTIDGDAAIQAGREALDQHMGMSDQPGRGE